MRIVIAVFLACVFVSSYAKSSEFSVEQAIFGEESPIKMIMKGLLEEGKMSEVATYISLANKAFPLLTAKADSKGNGLNVLSAQYTYCVFAGGEHDNWCFKFDWSIIIGFESSQFSDDDRFYNLTVAPFARINLNSNISYNIAPFSLAISPSFNIFDWSAPLSFEIADAK